MLLHVVLAFYGLMAKPESPQNSTRTLGDDPIVLFRAQNSDRRTERTFTVLNQTEQRKDNRSGNSIPLIGTEHGTGLVRLVRPLSLVN